MENPAGTQPPTGAEPSADQKMADMVNGAVTSQLKRMLPKALEEGLTPHFTAFESKLSAMLPKAPESKRDAGSSNAEVEELRAEIRREKEARLAEKRVAREERALSDLRTELTGKVRPEVVTDLADLLFHARKRVKVGSDGNVQFTVGDVDHDLKTGVLEFLNTKEAAFYKPAPAPAQKGRGMPSRTAPVRPAPSATPGATTREDPAQKTARELGWG